MHFGTYKVKQSPMLLKYIIVQSCPYLYLFYFYDNLKLINHLAVDNPLPMSLKNKQTNKQKQEDKENDS